MIAIGTLCSGLDGFGYCAERLGWQLTFWCEVDKYCQLLLKQNHPDATGYADIKTTDFTIHSGRIDVLAFGDPCQPHSIAGSGKGEDDPRFLWPDCRRAYNAIKPTVIINENVAGSLSNGIVDRKIIDLEADGYTCWPPLLIPAGAGGSLGRRDRVFLVAYCDSQRRKKQHLAAIAEGQTEGTIWDNAKHPTAYGNTSWNTSIAEVVGMAHGVSTGLYRNQRIKALGNSVDTRVIMPLLQSIEILLLEINKETA